MSVVGGRSFRLVDKEWHDREHEDREAHPPPNDLGDRHGVVFRTGVDGKWAGWGAGRPVDARVVVWDRREVFRAKNFRCALSVPYKFIEKLLGYRIKSKNFLLTV